MSDAIVIIGCPLFLTPHASLALKTRADFVIDLFERGVAQRIICSGKYSYAQRHNPPPKTESEDMQDIFLRKGIPASAIILESESTDTASNAYYVKKILIENGWKSIVLVTSKLHAPRALFWFEKILGPQYTVQIQTSSHPILEDEALTSSEREKIQRYQKMLEDIAPGDHRNIWERLIARGEDRAHSSF